MKSNHLLNIIATKAKMDTNTNPHAARYNGVGPLVRYNGVGPFVTFFDCAQNYRLHPKKVFV